MISSMIFTIVLLVFISFFSLFCFVSNKSPVPLWVLILVIEGHGTTYTALLYHARYTKSGAGRHQILTRLINNFLIINLSHSSFDLSNTCVMNYFDKGSISFKCATVVIITFLLWHVKWWCRSTKMRWVCFCMEKTQIVCVSSNEL